MIHSHGYRGGIAYPNPITNRMVDLVSERFLCLTKGDGRISVVLEACHGADVAEDGNSFAAQIHKLGIRVFAPEWLSQGIKSIQVDPEGYVTHLEFKAIGTKLFNHHIH